MEVVVMVHDLQKCLHIINIYGTEGQKEAMNKLIGLTWDDINMCKETKGILKAITDGYMLDTANEIYANNKDNHKNEWFMIQ
jgi:hypothetical protein